MRAWVVAKPGPMSSGPLELTDDRPVPEPGPGQLLVKVIACGVCRTDLHLAERLKIKVTTTPYPFSQADQALTDLEAERVHGAAVLQM